MWSGTSIPNGWILCDGTNGTPNLKDRFIVGAGNDYNIGALGGTNDVTLSESQMPTHSHAGSTANNGSHKHTGSTYAAGSHRHGMENGGDQGGLPGGKIFVSNGSHVVVNNLDRAFTKSAGSHTHTLNVANAGEHNHSFTTNNKGGNQPHENRPPYHALAFIMFKGF